MTWPTGRCASPWGSDVTEEQIDCLIQSVTETVAYLRSISPVWRDLQQGVRDYIIA